MNQFKFLQSGFLMLLALACAPKQGKLVFGVTTKQDLIQLQGQPVEDNKHPEHQVEILTYSQNQKYQFKENVLEAQWRYPSEEESRLLYWKHKYRHSLDQFVEIEKPHRDHHDVTVEYQLKSEGLTLVYHPTLDQVIRVVEYEKIKP